MVSPLLVLWKRTAPATQSSLGKSWQLLPEHRGDAICWKDCARCLLPHTLWGVPGDQQPALGQKQAADVSLGAQE